MTLILGTLVYPIRDGQVLLMHRHKAPNLGQWVGPGGKVEADESPYECAIRELYEETSLHARQPRFRGLVTEVSPRPDWHWMLFIYTVTDFEGQVLDQMIDPHGFHPREPPAISPQNPGDIGVR